MKNNTMQTPMGALGINLKALSISLPLLVRMASSLLVVFRIYSINTVSDLSRNCRDKAPTSGFELGIFKSRSKCNQVPQSMIKNLLKDGNNIRKPESVPLLTPCGCGSYFIPILQWSSNKIYGFRSQLFSPLAYY